MKETPRETPRVVPNPDIVAVYNEAPLETPDDLVCTATQLELEIHGEVSGERRQDVMREAGALVLKLEQLRESEIGEEKFAIVQGHIGTFNKFLGISH